MPPTNGIAVTEHVPEGATHPGPVVVLVHGSLDRSTSFARVLRRLGDLHTVVYDRRGYHRSRRALPLNTTLSGHVDDLLAVVDGRPAVVVGHSYGGDVALGAALAGGVGSSIRAVCAYEPPMPWLGPWARRPRNGNAPETTTGSMTTTGSVTTGSVTTTGPGTVGAGTVGDPVGPDDALAAERFFRRMVGDSAWERLPEDAKQARRDDGGALSAELADLRISEAPFDVSTLTIPALYARGENSAERHRRSVVWLVDHTPGAELVEFPGAGHGAHLTHPDAFASMVRLAVERSDEPAHTSA